MLPDILGFILDEGIIKLNMAGIVNDDIIIEEYYSPRKEKIGEEKRILKVYNNAQKIILIVGCF
ncbi:hypothetical protein OXPF_20790 [Oxobacter pfennigii]|uniref:Uncharacterized protein n=1 Tax=Oxobacter pfennigii TaxID=36849 RepID=A0A0P8YW40_9CLOT|nr:hypothetical protein [Oxobacter pfennigii]KPU43914.1 hypothetical protein OXPF_20790 [Oxobacter pfennigii]